MPDPLKEIEEAQAQRGVGATGWRIFCGAREDGANRKEACGVLVCWFRALLQQADANTETEDA